MDSFQTFHSSSLLTCVFHINDCRSSVKIYQSWYIHISCSHCTRWHRFRTVSPPWRVGTPTASTSWRLRWPRAAGAPTSPPPPSWAGSRWTSSSIMETGDILIGLLLLLSWQKVEQDCDHCHWTTLDTTDQLVTVTVHWHCTCSLFITTHWSNIALDWLVNTDWYAHRMERWSRI